MIKPAGVCESGSRGGGVSEERGMSKKSTNAGKSWTSNDVRQLKGLASGNTPTRVIGLKMGRSSTAVQSKASSAGVSLKPANQSPYGTKKR